MRTLPLLAAAVGLGLASCGGSDEGSGSGPALTGGKNTVSMRNIAFEPKELTVKEGETVTWVNDEDIAHNAVATEGADFRSDLFGKGGTYAYKATKAGTIRYVCTVHPGMEGTLTVTAGG